MGDSRGEGDVELTKALGIMAQAWGRNQSGYAFLPWISGRAKDKAARIQSYNEGPAFLWPQDRDKILSHMAIHQTDDLYWCPMLFELPRRQTDAAMDEYALWADLDEVDPTGIKDYPPTYAWETSPGRYQALWVITSPAGLQGASWPGNENQKLTYHLGADSSGWDTTQLLRIPGWVNHKPEYRDKGGKGPRGSLVIEYEIIPGDVEEGGGKHRHTYSADAFTELPSVPGIELAEGLEDILEDSIDRIDRHEVWGNVRLKVSKLCREYMGARTTEGADRSSVLWQMERDLADAGCSVQEIVALVRETVWNKYQGRQDEFRRLVTEAQRAYNERKGAGKEDSKPGDELEPLEVVDEAKYPTPTYLTDLIASVKEPKWLVKGIWTEGACGFIAGAPKTFKSWCGFDLALSVATGMPFLGHLDFKVTSPGPVLYIQAEDALPTIKRRYRAIWATKGTTMDLVRNTRGGVDEIILGPAGEAMGKPPLMALVREDITLSDPAYQGWLDEVLTRGLPDTGEPYRLVVMDPLMMLMGDVDENRAAVMTTKIFRPLKQLAQKHHVAICVVHHMNKVSNNNAAARLGQRMLGSVANHAWAEDSLYLEPKKEKIEVQRESKTASELIFMVGGITKSKGWNPIVSDIRGMWDDEEVVEEKGGKDGHEWVSCLDYSGKEVIGRWIPHFSSGGLLFKLTTGKNWNEVCWILHMHGPQTAAQLRHLMVNDHYLTRTQVKSQLKTLRDNNLVHLNNSTLVYTIL